MEQLKFNITSDQLELLLAFENAQGLGHLAELMRRDPSVISRSLQKIAEELPVIIKVRGRWQITPLGMQVNHQTRAYLEELKKLIALTASVKTKELALWNENSALVVINAQNGLLDATQEGRNNSEAEQNIELILKHWRTKKRRVIHVKHISNNPESIFFHKSPGCDFLEGLKPQETELVLEKTKSSAFAGTNLDTVLKESACSEITLVGFTANECIDATARDAEARGYTTFVVGDGTATFDLRDQSGKLIKADRIHRLTLITLNALYAKVVDTQDILA